MLKSSKIKFALIFFIAFTLLFPTLTINESAAATYTDSYNWRDRSIQFNHVFFDGGFWGNSSDAVAVMRETAGNVYVLWFNINSADPYQELTAYNITQIGSNLAWNQDYKTMITQYNDTAVLVLNLRDIGGLSTDERASWYTATAYNSTYGFTELMAEYDPTANEWAGANGYLTGMSNIVEHGSDFYCAFRWYPDAPAFNEKLNIIALSSGIITDEYDVTGALPSATDPRYHYMVLFSGDNAGSTNRQNFLYTLFPSNTNSGVNTDKQVFVTKTNVPTTTTTTISTGYGTWPVNVNSIRSANWIAYQALDKGGGATFGVLVNYLCNDGDTDYVNIQIADGSGDSNTFAYQTFTGFNGYRPFGRYSSSWSETVLLDDSDGNELSAGVISSFGIGTSTTLVVAVSHGTLGAPITVPNTLDGYRYENEYQIEISSGWNLAVYSFAGEAAETGITITYIENEVGFGGDLATNLNQTMDASTTYLYIENLENSAPTIVTRLELYHIGNATNTAEYSVTVGIYIASNQDHIGLNNPLTNVYSRTFYYTGDTPTAYNITLTPNLQIPSNSFGAVAYSSSCDLLVNQTILAQELYSTYGYLPPTITSLDSEGVDNKALGMTHQQMIATGDTVSQGSDNVTSSQFNLFRVTSNLAISFGLDSLTMGMILWVVTCFIFFALLYRLGISYPMVYGVIFLAVSIIFQQIGLIPTWFTMVMILGVIGLSAVTIGSKITGSDH